MRVEGDGLVLARELLQRARPGRGTPGRQEAQEGKLGRGGDGGEKEMVEIMGRCYSE